MNVYLQILTTQRMSHHMLWLTIIQCILINCTYFKLSVLPPLYIKRTTTKTLLSLLNNWKSVEKHLRKLLTWNIKARLNADFFPLINLFGKSQSFLLVWLYKYPKLCPKLLNLFCQKHGFQKRWILTGMENKETYGVSVANELKEMMNSATKITILSELSQTEKYKWHMISHTQNLKEII